MFESVLVPTDGGDGADRAVERALDVARRYDATVHALYVVDTDRYCEPALGSTQIVLDELETKGVRVLSRVEDRATDRGVEVVTHCVHGSPGRTIVETADDLDADLIVLGDRGRGRRAGTVTDRVLATAGRPVMAT